MDVVDQAMGKTSFVLAAPNLLGDPVSFQDTNREDSWSTEGKNGIPRYDGDLVSLQGYQFRVRMREAREEKMEKTERDKLGP